MSTEANIARLRQNVPLQEAGRVTQSELSVWRANRSVRLWEHGVSRLAAGQQPDMAEVEGVGYRHEVACRDLKAVYLTGMRTDHEPAPAPKQRAAADLQTTARVCDQVVSLTEVFLQSARQIFLFRKLQVEPLRSTSLRQATSEGCSSVVSEEA